jgi:hypothetical protein
MKDPEVLELNLSDLLDRASKSGRILPQNASPQEALEALEKGPGNFEGGTLDPELELRSAMTDWVLDFYDQIRAQVRCSLDCISCPIAHVTLCHLQNRRTLRMGGYLKEDNPWFLRR